MSERQESNWEQKIRELNEQDAEFIELSKHGRPDTTRTERNANKWLAAKLREFASIVESGRSPHVFEFDLVEKDGPFSRISVTLSYPWGG